MSSSRIRRMGAVNGDRVARAVRLALLLGSLAPALYVFIAIQYSAITVPFWDHTELIRWIASWYDGTFTIPSLWAWHNQARPLVYRVVMLFNALLTGWDIRSEYVYMYAAIFGTFAVHVRALRRLTDSDHARMVFPVALLIISLMLFSPAGHNNHWWSMMFALNVSNLLIALGLLTVFLDPHRWASHVIGVVCCCLAAYSITNGIFAMVAVIATLQLASRSWRPDRWAVFWALNLVVLLAVYMPGIPMSTTPVRPSIGQLAWFSLVYLGAPLGSILWFPFKSHFDLPLPTLFNGLCGLLLVTTAGLLAWRARERLRTHHPAALILVGFVIFAGVSALATAWGRANIDSSGISNANASRYTIFGVYLLLGIIYYLATLYAEHQATAPRRGETARWKWGRSAVASGLIGFVVLSCITYARAIPIYLDAHDFNQMLSTAYTWGLAPTLYDQFIHPNPDFVRELKGDLQRLQLGPYRNRPMQLDQLPVGQYQQPFPLVADARLTARFHSGASGLKELGVTMVTWNNSQSAYRVNWRLFAMSGPKRILRAAGNFDSTTASDWQPLWIQLPYLQSSAGRTYEIEFSVTGQPDAQHVVGFPLYSVPDGQSDSESVTMAGSAVSQPLTLGLWLRYAR